MKTAEVKTTTTASHQIQAKQQPFFSKEGQDGFFSKSNESSEAFFNPSGIQAKLTIGQPNDKYEVEADAMADQVVQKLSSDSEPIQHLGYDGNAAIQAKCNQCGEEEKVQKKEDEAIESEPGVQTKPIFESDAETTGSEVQIKSLLAPAIQPKCNHCEEEEKVQEKEEEGIEEEQNIQKKEVDGLTIGEPDDAYEKEADTMADTMVQKLSDPNSEPQASGSHMDTIDHTSNLSISTLQTKCETCEEEEKQEEEMDGPQVQRKAGAAGEDQTALRVDEFMAGRSWEEAQADKMIMFKQAPSLQLSSGGSGESSVRQRIEDVARKELGKVEARVDDGTGRRVGADRLLEYFHLAAPGEWSDEVIEHARYTMEAKQFPHWCGIFSVYAIKKAGIDVGDWKMGVGVSQFNTLQQTKSPQKGDVGYIHEPYRHHCIITEVNGDTVKSIDGNSGTKSEVIERTRPITKYTGFFTAFTGSEKYIQKKEDAANSESGSTGLQDKLSAKSGKGSPMDETTRSQMESGFGADFSGVNIHTDSQAVEMNKGLNAQAFTHGNDIYFNEGKYNPETTSGKHLLAHELTHTVQQGASLARRIQKNEEDDRDSLDFEVLSGSPPRAELSAPYSDSYVAKEFYGNPEHKLKWDLHNANILEVSYASLLKKWKKKFAAVVSPEILRSNIKNLADQLSKIEKLIDDLEDKALAKEAVKMKLLWQVFIDDFPKTGDKNLDLIPNPDAELVDTLPADLMESYKTVVRDIKIYFTAQHYKGKPVLGGGYMEPEHIGSLSQYIGSQSSELAWLLKDTNRLLEIFNKEEIPKEEQWEIVGLFRQHMNPWNFYLMAKAVDLHNKDPYSKLDLEISSRLWQLVKAIGTIREEEFIGPAGRLGDFQLLPADGKVKLLQPQTPKELATELYGKANLWTKYLLPYNRAALDGLGGDSFIETGKELIVDPLLLVDQYKGLFVATAVARDRRLEEGHDAYIKATPKAVAVIGNELSYTIIVPNSAFEEISLEWWVENDPLAAEDSFWLGEKTNGPKGKLRWVGDSINATWNLEAGAAGNHTIKCKLDYGEGGPVEILSYTQVVMTLDEKTDIDFDKAKLPPNLSKHEADLEKKLKEIPKTKENEDQIEAIKKQLEAIKNSKKEGYRLPIKAVYVSEEDQPISISLLAYIGHTDEIPLFDADERYHLSLWDFSMEGKARRYAYSGHSLEETAKNLLEDFADDAPYPDGQIKFTLNLTSLGTIPAYHHGQQDLAYPTDGGMIIDDVLRGLSIGALVIGVGAAALGQAEIAVPAFYLSGLLGGAAATANLADRLEHGDFEWDLETGMDVLDIVGALVTLGMSGVVTNSVKGVGKMTTIGRIARGLPQGIDAIQIGVLAGVHVSNIAASVESGDEERIRDAILRALADGALFFIVHKASKRLADPGGRKPKRRPDDGRTPGGGNDSDLPGLTKEESFSRWERTLNPETRKWLADNPDAFERYYNMSPRVRRLLTACRSDCIPKEATADDIRVIEEMLGRAASGEHQFGLKEYLYDHRDSLTASIEEFPSINTRQQLTEFLDRYVSSTARGGSASKVGDRWHFTKDNGKLVLEYDANSHRELTKEGTNNFFQSHHGVQDKWSEVKLGEIGYNRNDAPALLLRDSFSGSPHQTINRSQTKRGKDYESRTYEDERSHSIGDLRAGHVPQQYIDAYLVKADAYYGKLYDNYKTSLEADGLPSADVEARLKELFGNWKPS